MYGITNKNIPKKICFIIWIILPLAKLKHRQIINSFKKASFLTYRNLFITKLDSFTPLKFTSPEFAFLKVSIEIISFAFNSKISFKCILDDVFKGLLPFE